MNYVPSNPGTNSSRLIPPGNQLTQNDVSKDASPGQAPTLKNQPTPVSPLPAPSHSEAEKEQRDAMESGNSVTVTSRASQVDETHSAQQSSHQPLTAEEVADGMKQAIIEGDLNKLIYLVEKEGGDINHRFDDESDSSGCLIHMAIFKKQLHIYQWLVDRGANINAYSNDGHTTLFNLIKRGYLDLAHALIKRDDFALQSGERYIWSGKRIRDDSLRYAAEAGDLELVKFLFERGFTLNAQGKCRHSAVNDAAIGGSLEVLQWMAAQGADLCSSVRARGDRMFMRSPFSHALAFGHQEVAEWLISKGAIDKISPSMKQGWLLHAVYKGFTKIVRSLIEHGADVNACSDFDGTPLHHALENLRTTPPNNKKCQSLIDIVYLLAPLSDLEITHQKKTPLLYAVEHDLMTAAPALIEAILKFPKAQSLIAEVLPLAKGVLFKDLLLKAWLKFSSDSTASKGVSSYPVIKYISEQSGVLQTIKNQLGAPNDGLSPVQQQSAINGIHINLLSWGKNLADREGFYGDVDPNFPIHELQTLNNTCVDDIDQLYEKSKKWQAEIIQPVFNNLFTLCNSLPKSATLTKDIIETLTRKGIYHPIAAGIAAAWESASKLHSQSGNSSSAIRSESLQTIFRTEIQKRFDSIDAGWLNPQDKSLPQASKDLYSDLMWQQLTMLSAFWKKN